VRRRVERRPRASQPVRVSLALTRFDGMDAIFEVGAVTVRPLRRRRLDFFHSHFNPRLDFIRPAHGDLIASVQVTEHFGERP
jgi:hypothetical protein